MRSCVTATGIGAFVVAVLIAGWFARDDIGRFVSRLGGAEADSTATSASSGPELARRAEMKIVALGQGELEEATLSAVELDSWIRYGLEGFFPEYVSEVSTAIEEQRLVLSGRVALEEVPGIERLGPALAFFGDTAAVVVRGELDGLGRGRGVYYVEAIQVGLLPLPESMRDQLLDELKAGLDDEDLPGNAVSFVLPSFVTDIGVRGEQVFLRRQ